MISPLIRLTLGEGASPVYGPVMADIKLPPSEVQGDPRLVYCTTCYSKPGEPCTQPTDDGQRKVPWHHLAREAAARQADRSVQ